MCVLSISITYLYSMAFSPILVLFVCLFVCLFETGSYYVAQAGLELILLPQPLMLELQGCTTTLGSTFQFFPRVNG
jgi:hypothetical protein